ncbi:VOC family protein [Granulicatella adiacens ATCC 49175]|uniref:Glyoxalase family protein n=1 Tax=Granulicatella adiacens ATCC 49175 TaxID=638301 RepID=C8NFM6_9LACT|nr:VOC family protein [Granulicatella adiacens]EEW37362.1 glyoxalase family protein [Granulicatella adiacens ATCC 49175]UAK93429.1 VOC family protein [Granulicatella adiacens]UWP37573.1 VOC family protein [Granulicatella adiacens ATCC 49175]
MYPLYNSQIQLNEVALNVNHLLQETEFYTKGLGLQILSQSDNEVLLGVGTTTLVRLIQTNIDKGVKESYGLYHLAIHLPTREALGDFLRHAVHTSLPLIGASDHGYSEAIYLEDFEGNGIEVYHDKPVSVWDIREDGRIIGVTEEMAGQEIYELGHDTIPYQMPEGTRMGHVHLSAKNSKESMEYLTTLLPVEDKFSVPSGSWIASGDYHHHLAVNQWGGPHLDVRVKNIPGLAYYTVETNDASVFKEILQKATVLATTVEKRGEKEVDITDNHGITVRVTLNN